MTTTDTRSTTYTGQRYATELLVTDTRAYDVVASTAKTIKVRNRPEGEVVDTYMDGGPFPVVFNATKTDTDYPIKTLRLRKDGTYRMADWAKPLWFQDEEPTTRTDYRF